MSKYTELEILKTECLDCRRCGIGGQLICGKFLSNVFSNMNCDSKYLVVGQNPGGEEVEKKEPFVGISGKMFNQLIEEVLGMKRLDFYISNICKCMTPNNRKPTKDEIMNCQIFLEREIDILKPEIVISLGGPAFEQLTGMHGIMKHHGCLTFSPKYKLFVFPLLHPSPLNLNDPAKLELFVSDLMKLQELISKLKG